MEKKNLKNGPLLFLTMLLMQLLLFTSPGLVSAESVSTTPGSAAFVSDGSAVVVDAGLTVSASGGNITDFKVSITTGFDSGKDTLAYTGVLPSGVTAAYGSATGILSFTGATSDANWQALLRTVTFSTSSTSTTTRAIAFTLGNAIPYSGNGHFYKNITTSGTWSSSKAAAAVSTLFGLQGYLATITSQAENDFLLQKLGADSWIGASDDYTQINSSCSTSYSQQSDTEGKWYWVTGPEKCTQFSNGNDSPVAVGSNFMNWNAGEPNNNAGTEHYGLIYSTGASPGKWNDLGATNTYSYVVEYGGMAGDPAVQITASKDVTIQPATTTTTVNPYACTFQVKINGVESTSLYLDKNTNTAEFSVVPISEDCCWDFDAPETQDSSLISLMYNFPSSAIFKGSGSFTFHFSKATAASGDKTGTLYIGDKTILVYKDNDGDGKYPATTTSTVPLIPASGFELSGNDARQFNFRGATYDMTITEFNAFIIAADKANPNPLFPIDPLAFTYEMVKPEGAASINEAKGASINPRGRLVYSNKPGFSDLSYWEYYYKVRVKGNNGQTDEFQSKFIAQKQTCSSSSIESLTRSDLDVLRKFRDVRLMTSRSSRAYARQYYVHSPGMLLLFLLNPELKERTEEVVRELLPLFETAAAGDDAWMDESLRARVLELIDEMIAQPLCSKALRQDLLSLQRDLKNGWLWQLGIRTYGETEELR